MKIDFYIVEDARSQQALLLACQLIEKAYGEHQPLYVHTASAEQANRLDLLLWTFREDSFVPHSLYPSDQSTSAPVLIGFGEPPTTPRQLLFNLSNTLPSFYEQFNHLVEIVFSEPVVQQLARDRYKQYREQGHELSTHKLKVSAS